MPADRKHDCARCDAPVVCPRRSDKIAHPAEQPQQMRLATYHVVSSSRQSSQPLPDSCARCTLKHDAPRSDNRKNHRAWEAIDSEMASQYYRNWKRLMTSAANCWYAKAPLLFGSYSKIDCPKLGASLIRTDRGMTVRNTSSLKCSRTS